MQKGSCISVPQHVEPVKETTVPHDDKGDEIDARAGDDLQEQDRESSAQQLWKGENGGGHDSACDHFLICDHSAQSVVMEAPISSRRGMRIKLPAILKRALII